jgi:hypothetical protein
MKDLLIVALDNAFADFSKRIPQTKKKTESVSIMDVKPMDLVQFMKDNEIPESACFDGRDNGYDAWDDILLSWDVDVPTTEKDKLEYCRDRFSTPAFRFVYDTLTKNGYKRVGYNTGLLKPFKGTTVYDMYTNKDFDRLVDYYSLPFKKE